MTPVGDEVKNQPVNFSSDSTASNHYRSRLPVVVMLTLAVLTVLIIAIFVSQYRLIAIRSGSMEPHWGRGALLVLSSEPVSQLKVGQDVAYFPPPRLFDGLLVHQVMDVLSCSSRSCRIRTKGTANPVLDPWIGVVTTPVWHVDLAIPFVGYIPILLQHLIGDL